MTDRGDRIAKKLYLREYSNVLRKRKNVIGLHSLKEDIPASLNDGLARYIIVMICRNKQRLCQQAWSRWTKNTSVVHDYTKDLRSILLRKIPDDQPRTELEIEILCKWANQIGDNDPTGIAYAINNCKSKEAIINLFQHCRLECYSPHQTILFQGSLPRIEDGHFTVIQGEVEIVCVEDGSVKLLQLQNFAKDQKWEAAKALLADSKSLATIQFPGGFGELATLSHAPRTATVRAGSYGITEILVVPKKELMECLGRGSTGGDSGKAIDFLRQTGLSSKLSPKELLTTANSMKKHTFLKGDILFLKGEPVKSLYLVVSGDILLDVNDCDISKHQIPFLNPEINNYHSLSSGSILGDEGLTGQDNRYESSAVVVSNAAVIFEATGFSFSFLAERIGAIRYCALAYKQLPRLSPAITVAEDINVYSNFNTLRKCIAYSKPQRGKLPKSTLEDDTNQTNASENSEHKMNSHKKFTKQQSNQKKVVSKIALENKRLAEEALANSGIKSKTVNGAVMRTLAAVPMHHALNIYRVAKKRSIEIVKIFARDNILNGEIENDIKQPKLTLSSVNDSQRKLKTAIEHYHERMKDKLQDNKNENDQTELQLAEVHNLQSLLGSMAASAAINDQNDDEEDNYKPHQRKSSVYFDDNPFLEIQVLGAEYASISRIEQYYMYIDYLCKEGITRPTSPINTENFSPDTRPEIPRQFQNNDDGSQSTVNVLKNKSEKRGVDPLRISIEPWRPPSPSSKPHHELLAESFSKPLSPKYLDTAYISKPNMLTAATLKNNDTRPTTAMTNFLEDKEQTSKNDVKKETGPKFWRLPVPKIRHCLQLDQRGNLVHHRATVIKTDGTTYGGFTQDMTNSMIDAIDTSEEFWKAINNKEFPIRKAHRPKHLWVTRAVKVGPFAKNEDFIGSEEWADKLFGKYVDVEEKKPKKYTANTEHKDIKDSNPNTNNDNDDKKGVVNESGDIMSDPNSNINNDNDDQQENDVDNEKEIDNEMEDIPNDKENCDGKAVLNNSPRKHSLNSVASSEEVATNKVEMLEKQPETLNAAKKWPERLALSDPSSEAIDKYNELIRIDISSRKFLDGKKRSAISSKFVLPKKISSAREIEYGSSAEDMSMALLSCLLPEEGNDSSIVRDTIKKQRDEFIRPQLQFNSILNETDNILQDASSKKNVDVSINSWQQMTVDRVIDHQLGPKYTLPVLYKGKDGTINRTKRFAGSLAVLPPAKQEYLLDGPTSFLELYKNNPKKTYRS